MESANGAQSIAFSAPAKNSQSFVIGKAARTGAVGSAMSAVYNNVALPKGLAVASGDVIVCPAAYIELMLNGSA